MNGNWKVGLLGAGFIIEAHAKALNNLKSVNLVAVCDQSRTAAEKASSDFGIENVYTSLEEMLKSDIDVVHVLLPPDFHIDTGITGLTMNVPPTINPIPPRQINRSEHINL